MSDSCPSCGLAAAGGAEGCQRLFESIGLREFEDMRFARYHRIVVDVYAMQHPDRYGRSAKSFAAHLTGLCAWVEDEDGAQSVNASVQRWLHLGTEGSSDRFEALLETGGPAPAAASGTDTPCVMIHTAAVAGKPRGRGKDAPFVPRHQFRKSIVIPIE